MFERLTEQARRAVELAQREAAGFGHNYIGTEHLLLGLIAEPQAGAALVLEGLGLRQEAVRREVLRIIGPGEEPSEPDAGALETIGIDLDAVRRKVEETFGPGAFERARAARYVRKRWRRGGRLWRKCPPAPGARPFTPRAKKVLELAVGEADRLGHGYVGTEHLLAGIVEEGEGVAVELLKTFSVDPSAVREKVRQVLERGADSA